MNKEIMRETIILISMINNIPEIRTACVKDNRAVPSMNNQSF